MIRQHQRERRGAALAVALFALVTVGAIAQAILAPAVASRRASHRLASHFAAEAAAERMLAATVGGWPPAQWRSLPHDSDVVEESVERISTTDAARATVTLRVRRLSATVFSVVVSATVPAPDVPVAVRRSVLVELHSTPVELVPALTSGGRVALAADSDVSGDPACAAVTDSAEVILVAPETPVTLGGSTLSEGVRRDAIASSPATYARPGGLDLSTLVAAATHVLPSGTVVYPGPAEAAGTCMPGPSNWGGAVSPDEPGSCAAYAPVVVAEGDLRITGGMGQGALVVTGHLEISGPFHYTGLIVAGGGIGTSGAVSINGAVFTAPDAAATFGEGPAAITASPCALEAAASAAARLRVVPLRGWWR